MTKILTQNLSRSISNLYQRGPSSAGSNQPHHADSILQAGLRPRHRRLRLPHIQHHIHSIERHRVDPVSPPRKNPPRSAPEELHPLHMNQNPTSLSLGFPYRNTLDQHRCKQPRPHRIRAKNQPLPRHPPLQKLPRNKRTKSPLPHSNRQNNNHRNKPKFLRSIKPLIPSVLHEWSKTTLPISSNPAHGSSSQS